MKKTWMLVTGIMILLLAVSLCGCTGEKKVSGTPVSVSEAAGTGNQPGGPKEKWSGQLIGRAVGAFICLNGEDSYYVENGTLSFTVPAPGMVAAMNTAQVTEFDGLFSNTEKGVEAKGTGCAPAPSVTSTTVAGVLVNIHIAQKQIQVNSTTILMPAHIRYSSNAADILDSRKILLNSENITSTSITGTWKADGPGGIDAGGKFVLTKVS